MTSTFPPGFCDAMNFAASSPGLQVQKMFCLITVVTDGAAELKPTTGMPAHLRPLERRLGALRIERERRDALHLLCRERVDVGDLLVRSRAERRGRSPDQPSSLATFLCPSSSAC